MGATGDALRSYMRGKEVRQTGLISLTSDLSSVVPQQTLASTIQTLQNNSYSDANVKNVPLNIFHKNV